MLRCDDGPDLLCNGRADPHDRSMAAFPGAPAAMRGGRSSIGKLAGPYRRPDMPGPVLADRCECPLHLLSPSTRRACPGTAVGLAGPVPRHLQRDLADLGQHRLRRGPVTEVAGRGERPLALLIAQVSGYLGSQCVLQPRLGHPASSRPGPTRDNPSVSARSSSSRATRTSRSSPCRAAGVPASRSVSRCGR